ncbi:hypothetical protein RUND412_009988, partial [Rhizina undulata]
MHVRPVGNYQRREFRCGTKAVESNKGIKHLANSLQNLRIIDSSLEKNTAVIKRLRTAFGANSEVCAEPQREYPGAEDQSDGENNICLE